MKYYYSTKCFVLDEFSRNRSSPGILPIRVSRLKLEKLFGNPIRRTESGRLCYVSRSDLYNVDTDTETDVDRADS